MKAVKCQMVKVDLTDPVQVDLFSLGQVVDLYVKNVEENRNAKDILHRLQKAAKKSKRHAVLLRAAYDLLTRADRATLVEEAVAIQTHYDGADCDGYCLREDIAFELDIEDETDPIPLKEEEEDGHQG